MKRAFFIIVLLLLLLVSSVLADTDVDLDTNSAVDIAFGGTNAKTVAGARANIVAWGAPGESAISSGVVSLSRLGSYKITVETGVSDDLDKITGLNEGDEVILAPTSGDATVVVKNGTYLKLQNGADFELNHEYDRIRLLCIGSDTCVELQRSSGGD